MITQKLKEECHYAKIFECVRGEKKSLDEWMSTRQIDQSFENFP